MMRPMIASNKRSFHKTGFSLVEMAIVLLIVAVLLGGLLPTLSGQVEQKRRSETSKQIDEIKEALIGYAIVNGRIPCPATTNSNGTESFASGGSASNGNCANFYNGYVPAAALGLAGTDSSGFAVDAWGNRIRYAVTLWSRTSPTPAVDHVFTSTNGMSTVGISNISQDLLLVCSTATSITSTNCATGTSLTPQGVPAVIYSTGKNVASGGSGIDETANTDSNKTFVSHIPAPRSATNGAFDDLVTWLSPNTLFNRMVAAGKLP